MDFVDVSGQPRSDKDLEAALRCLQHEIVKNPMAMAKNGEPFTIHYLTIIDVLKAELARRGVLT